MKKFLVVAVLLVMVPVSAYAGVDIKGWISNVGVGALALALTAVIAIGGLVSRAKWLSAILVAIGQFFLTLGNALQDGKIEKDELTAIKDKGGDVIDAAKKKPE
jgi:hypothetical protein